MDIRLAALLTTLIATPAVAKYEVLHTGEHFAVECTDASLCGSELDDGKHTATAQELERQMERGYAWLKELGFPVDQSVLEKGEAEGTRALRLQANLEQKEKACYLANANACHISNLGHSSRMIIPLAKAGSISEDASTLVHEYVHSLQPLSDAGQLDWLKEAVPTAVGEQFSVLKQGLADGIYPPIYYLSLDLPMYENIEGGYGVWAYLLATGERMGSKDSVAWLAAPKILEVATNPALSKGDAASGMKLFYDTALVAKKGATDAGEAATFDKVFPAFVARFNTFEEAPWAVDAEGYRSRDSDTPYYTKVGNEIFEIEQAPSAASDTFKGQVPTYAASPILIQLEVTPVPDKEPKDTLMMVEMRVESDKHADDLRLVLEHRLAKERLRHQAMLDGSNAPDQLAFFRLVNAPDSYKGAAKPADYELKIEARPIALGMPRCAQTGLPFVLEPEGFELDDADNWRLETDNGTVDGLGVTPSHAGKMELTLEIDSLVTRAKKGIHWVKPKKTRVSLGTVEVQADDCMVRAVMGGPGRKATVTYSAAGDYSEFKIPGGGAMYHKPGDMAMWQDGGWVAMPPQMKGIMLGAFGNQLPIPSIDFGEDAVDDGHLMPRMPQIFSKRFAWSRARKLPGVDGKPVRRVGTACPDGGKGCTSATVVSDGHTVPVTFDAQGRPLHIDLGRGATMTFEYGLFDIRRPPGW